MFDLIIFSLRQLKSRLFKCLSSQAREKKSQGWMHAWSLFLSLINSTLYDHSNFLTGIKQSAHICTCLSPNIKGTVTWRLSWILVSIQHHVPCWAPSLPLFWHLFFLPSKTHSALRSFYSSPMLSLLIVSCPSLSQILSQFKVYFSPSGIWTLGGAWSVSAQHLIPAFGMMPRIL